MAIGRILAGLIIVCLGYANAQDLTEAPTSSDASGTCQCEYIEQPPNELQCDPYQPSELRLECTILFPTSQTSKEIAWFRSHLQPPSQETGSAQDSDLDLWLIDRLDNTQPDILIREQTMTTANGQNTWIRSQLLITNLNDSYVGDYWCRIKVDNTDWLLPSDSVYLQQASAYSHFGPCSNQFAQSKQERKCAGWDATNVKTTPPSMLPITHTSIAVTTVHTQETTTTNTPPSTTEDISATNTPPSTTEDSSATTAHLNLSSTVIGGDNGVPEDEDEPDNSRSLTTELYVSISILVLFGVMVFILVPVTLYMCIKRRRQRGHRLADLERVRPIGPDLERRSATMPAAATDYLVPQPFLGLTREQLQLQTQRMNRAHSLHRHTLGLSHEYEDIMDYVNEDEGSYVNDTLPVMKRNEAYRPCNTIKDKKELVAVGCRDVVIPNPLYTQTHTGGESDDGSEDSLNEGSSHL